MSFQSEFAEIRALAPPGKNVIALTATADSSAKSLDMTNHVIVTKVPNNPNIFYAELPMPPSLMSLLRPIIDQQGREADRYLIFCRSYDDTLALYQTTAMELHSRGALCLDGLNTKSRNRLCDKCDDEPVLL